MRHVVRQYPARHSRVKRAVARRLRDLATITGRYQRRSLEETAAVQTVKVSFRGDIPSHSGDDRSQHLLRYAHLRPKLESVSNLIYTPTGMGWLDGRLVERFSINTPSVKDLLFRPQETDCSSLANATVVEEETPFTYGDWVGGYLATVLSSKSVVEPLLLPVWLANKPYVQRDLTELGIAFYAVERPVIVKCANVLPKQVPSYYWGPDEVNVYREKFGVRLQRSIRGSITYLSREHVISEVVQRRYPSHTVSAVVEGLGGTVIDTAKISERFEPRVASNTETVIADQGSAIFALLYWRAKNVIEITTRNWWHNCGLFLAHATGVENYVVIVCDDIDEAELRSQVLGHLQDFGVLR